MSMNSLLGGGVPDFGNPDRPEVEQLRRGAAAAIRGPRHQQNIMSDGQRPRAAH
jgi:hypothetical protein